MTPVTSENKVMDPQKLIEAAKRLRIVHNGINRSDARKLYDFWPYKANQPDWHIDAIREDRLYLSHLALSVVPDVDRPVLVKAGDLRGKQQGAWVILEDYPFQHPLHLLSDDCPCYASRRDVEAERQWDRFDEVMRLAD